PQQPLRQGLATDQSNQGSRRCPRPFLNLPHKSVVHPRAILTSAAGQKELKDSLLAALASAPVQRQLQDQVQSILTSPQGQKSLDALIRAALIKLASGGGGGGQERGTGG
ncbi:MAG: hypothetical protein M0Z27_01865, partial [Thermaerobacter sp.]|nr:hypothetical protein [Thermaerobacter sp.]